MNADAMDTSACVEDSVQVKADPDHDELQANLFDEIQAKIDLESELKQANDRYEELQARLNLEKQARMEAENNMKQTACALERFFLQLAT